MIGTHECPKRGCSLRIPNNKFACWQHWGELPSRLKSPITRTAGMPTLSSPRRRAIERALAWMNPAP